jgi:hypothetical protein
MKTILRIITLLLVAAVVAGAFSLAVNSSSSASTTSANTNGGAFQLTDRPGGGDHEGTSLAGGLGGVLGTLTKLTGISILVLLLQKGYSQLRDRRLALNER